MIYHQLGKSDLSVSTLGFGCMSLSLDQALNNNLVARAIAGGINFFDTADIYQKGENEKTLGIAIRSHRKELVIATKVGNQLRADGSGMDWNPRKAYILKEVENSLVRLQTDYIDLYQLHGGIITDPIDETISAFETLIQQGKIRYYGISSIRPNVIRQWLDHSSIVTVMMQYSLLDRRPEETCLELLSNNSVSLLARGVLAQGLLVDKTPKAYLGQTIQEVTRASASIKSISGAARSTVQTAVRFVLQNPVLGSVVAGIRTASQLTEMLGIYESPALSENDIVVLNQASVPGIYTEHR